MRKIVLPLALAGSACLAPVNDAEPEDVAETSAALTGKGPAIDPEAAQWIDENIPKWSIYIGGKGRDLHPGKDLWNRFTSVYYDDPRDSDLFAPVILVRRGDEDNPRRWVELSLTQHWMKGQRYFDELVECGTLTVMDLLVVMAELGRFADSYIQPSPVRVLPAATTDALRELRYRGRFTCKDTKPSKLHTFAGIENGPYDPPLPTRTVLAPWGQSLETAARSHRRSLRPVRLSRRSHPIRHPHERRSRTASAGETPRRSLHRTTRDTRRDAAK